MKMLFRQYFTLLLLLGLMLLSATPLVAERSGSSFFRSEGELIFQGDAGKFYRNDLDSLTGLIKKNKFETSIEESFAHLDLDYRHNVARRFIFDVRNRFLGRFFLPQDSQTGRFSEIDNELKLRFGISHDEKTVSEFAVLANHTRFTDEIYNPADLNLMDFWVMVDHSFSPRTYLTWKLGNEAVEYPQAKTEDYHRLHNRIKLTRYVMSVGATPKFFKYYAFEKIPSTLEAEERMMDIAWDFSFDWDSYEMRNAPAGDDYGDFTVTAAAKLIMSEFSELRTGISSRTRGHTLEAPGRQILDQRGNRFFFHLSHYLNRHLELVLSTDMQNYNRTSAPGFDYNEYSNSMIFRYMHRPHIHWDVEISNLNNAPGDATLAAIPGESERRLQSTWKRNYGENIAITWQETMIQRGVDGTQSLEFADFSRLVSSFVYSQRIVDNLTLDIGVRLDASEYSDFKENNFDEFYLHTATRYRF